MFMLGKTGLAGLANLPQPAAEPIVAFISLTVQNQKPERVEVDGALSLRDFLQASAKSCAFPGAVR